jgi:hypothetical protein
MSFPQTRLTLIQRLAAGGSQEDWYQFVNDYRGPVCRFALRWGARDLDEAEDLTAQTFEILSANRLLTRWAAHHSAKLRSVLCRVVRNLLANRNRVRQGRQELAADLIRHFEQLGDARDEQIDAFYAAWVEDVVQHSVESLAAEYYSQSKGDYVRVLYGRLCQRLTNTQAAEALALTPAMAEHYFRHARQQLAAKMEALVREQVGRYCGQQEAEEEFDQEWRQLGQHLADHGGLEQAVQRAYDLLDPVQVKRPQHPAALSRTLSQLASILERSSGPTNHREST